ncbi:type II toxin-antitoxin system prevent-host-death family antitoxin [Aerosakkonema funiforme]|uniref:type II toxin-antitoxin system prevent-host-death family antitoxin n=1 Tax=Aerosakkonema funiforme TaxID=1246630 RepID=UPI0035B80DB5
MELRIIEEQTIENNSIIRMTTEEVRDNFEQTVDRVTDGEESVILSKDGKDVAAIIPIEEFWLLERIIAKMEDEIDLEAVRAAREEKEENISLADLKKELGL